MRHRNRNLVTLLTASLALGASARLAAVTVHTWVDDQGVTHFADAPPGGDQPSRAVEVQEAAPAAGADAGGDYYSIVNQWQRMRGEREQQDALDLERARIDASRPPASRAQPSAEVASDEAPALLYPYPYRAPHHAHGGFRTPLEDDSTGPPSPRNAFVNAKPPTWPRER